MTKYFKYWTKYWCCYFFNKRTEPVIEYVHEYPTFKHSNTGRPNCEPLTIEKFPDIGLSAKEAAEALRQLEHALNGGDIEIPYALKPRK